MSKLATALGLRVRELRKARKLSQAALGEAARLSEEWIRKIERGDGAPSFDTIEALGKALKVQPVELFERPERSPALEKLIARAEALDAAELDWLLTLIDQIQARPRRKRTST